MNTICKSYIVAALFSSATPIISAQNSDQSPVFARIENPVLPTATDFAGIPVDLDRVDMYERLDRELTSMAYTHGNTLLVLKRANKYFPEIIPILKKHGVPTDMAYLACIESTLNPRAYSAAKAAGIWQFIPSTAKLYGLEVNDYVDERYNLEKATAAACRYFKDALAKYGNWESVAASYNGGMARITRELGSQNQTSAYDLFLADETSRYMFRLLAMKMIMEQPAKYGFHLSADQLYQPVKTQKIKVSSPVESWPDWAAEHGISYMVLREYNPWIRAKSLPNKTGKTYTVSVPEKSELKRSSQSKNVYNPNWITKK